jgi:hypothetical protein
VSHFRWIFLFTHVNRTVLCIIQYVVQVGSKVVCMQCPPNAFCNNGEIMPQPGFWYVVEAHFFFLVLQLAY